MEESVIVTEVNRVTTATTKVNDMIDTENTNSIPCNWNFVAKKLKENENSSHKILIYTVTWNLKGEISTKDEIKLLLGSTLKSSSSLEQNKFFHIYAIGTQECLRSIFSSFFNSDKEEWINLIKY